MYKLTLNDGNKIPSLGLGTYQMDKDKIPKLLSTSFEKGYRLIDTASLYGNQNEIGRFFQGLNIPRNEIFITSKLWNDSHYDVQSSLNKTLNELKLDFIDLYLIHWPSTKNGNYVNAWVEMIKLKEIGLIKSIGVSNFTENQIINLIDKTGYPPAVNQLEVHLQYQKRESLLWHKDKKITIQAWSPLWTGNISDENMKKLTCLSANYNKTIFQIALRWHIQRGIGAIPKTSNTNRIVENSEIFDFHLSENDMFFLSSLDRNKKIIEYPDDYI
ncbi:aldo/keto reductase [Xenorhabdus bovienii]|uniref:aldo/keto reductase n=1 Tax=Xenorhabdus bovienii TaxID=40576 RepID=UPI00237CBCFE|nr:aldo/keto reductase [Xenorhabdus bovienii]MDE1482044.1 aldo/keto reductase [Xenorhabdus bovienii]MDE9441117.1 aldo/keto reductase [Xenorhabdus bovienii]MDE9546567.1 aldo/keto reductase [Xenorhabdus bovienii]